MQLSNSRQMGSSHVEQDDRNPMNCLAEIVEKSNQQDDSEFIKKAYLKQ